MVDKERNLLRVSGVDDSEYSAIWWEDGGFSIQIEGRWHVRKEDGNYRLADEAEVFIRKSIMKEKELELRS